MNYRHIYHAGNFADIVKHTSLISILKSFLKKDKPFAVLDAFAGRAMYDVTSKEALATGESASGIQRLHDFQSNTTNVPSSVAKLLDIINSCDKNYYPGSPFLIQAMLNTHDRLVACELHPAEYEVLNQWIYYKNYNIDAYKAVKTFIPFKEKRGLIFLDPPFETKCEFDKLIQALKLIKQRAMNLCSLIWYPIKHLQQVKSFFNNYQLIGFAETLRLEFEIHISVLQQQQYFKNPHVNLPLTKCGLLIINPPNIKNDLDITMNFLIKNMFDNQAQYNIEVLRNM